MKMGKSKFKRLDAHGVSAINKTPVVSNPKNRAERRASARALRKKPRCKFCGLFHAAESWSCPGAF